MEPFIKYLEEGAAPANEEKGCARKTARYTLIGGNCLEEVSVDLC